MSNYVRPTFGYCFRLLTGGGLMVPLRLVRNFELRDSSIPLGDPSSLAYLPAK